MAYDVVRHRVRDIGRRRPDQHGEVGVNYLVFPLGFSTVTPPLWVAEVAVVNVHEKLNHWYSTNIYKRAELAAVDGHGTLVVQFTLGQLTNQLLTRTTVRPDLNPGDRLYKPTTHADRRRLRGPRWWSNQGHVEVWKEDVESLVQPDFTADDATDGGEGRPYMVVVWTFRLFSVLHVGF